MAKNAHQFEKFVYGRDPATLGARFEDWLEKFDLCAHANGIKETDANIKSIFLINISDELFEIYKTKRKSDKSDTYQEIRNMLSAHVKPKRCEFTEVCVFRRAQRLEGETASDFAMRLRSLAAHCNFTELEKEILRQFVIGIKMPEVERKLCAATDNPDLEKALQMATHHETLEANLNGLHSPTEREMGRKGINCLEEESINSVKFNKQRSYSYNQRGGQGDAQRQGATSQRPYEYSRNVGSDKCGNCGKQRHQNKDQCPARGKTCKKCGKTNHYAAVCRSGGQGQQESRGSVTNGQAQKRSHGNPPPQGKIGQITGAEDDEQILVNKASYDEYLRYVKSSQWLNALRQRNDKIGRINDGPRRTYTLMGREIWCLVDTGSPVNVIDEITFNSLIPKPKLEPCKTRFFPYGPDAKTPIPILGQFTARMEYKNRQCNAGFVVTKGEEEALMSFTTAKMLGIISMDRISKLEEACQTSDETLKRNAIKHDDILKRYPKPKSRNGRYTKEELKAMFPNAFSGKLGCVKGVKVHLDIDPTVKPVRQKLRPVPFHLRDAISKEIKRKVEMGILERVTDDMGPPEWVANIVPVL